MLDARLCDSRSKAQGLIMAGQVRVDGEVIDKAGTLIAETAIVEIKDRCPYVSRGGLKLKTALDIFEVPVEGKVCLDVGASTGGFTDCLLQHGASHVHAVDVGYGQLDWSLRDNGQVTVFEKTHILRLDPALLDPAPSMAVVDVSFISLKKVLPGVVQCLSGDVIIALLKPQFEYLDYCAIQGFDGVVKHSTDHLTILKGVIQDLEILLPGWSLLNLTESSIQGPKGNREFLLLLGLGSGNGVETH